MTRKLLLVACLSLAGLGLSATVAPTPAAAQPQTTTIDILDVTDFVDRQAFCELIGQRYNPETEACEPWVIDLCGPFECCKRPSDCPAGTVLNPLECTCVRLRWRFPEIPKGWLPRLGDVVVADGVLAVLRPDLTTVIIAEPGSLQLAVELALSDAPPEAIWGAGLDVTELVW